MKFAKMLGVASAAAFALMVTAGAGSAFALQVKSCENNTLATCTKSSVPKTTYKAKGTNVQLSNGFLTNTCTMEIEGQVTDAESLSGTDPMSASVEKAAFPVCSLAPTTPENLSWGLSTNTVEFPTGQVTSAKVTLAVPLVGNCTFAEDATHKVTGKWTNGSGTAKSSVTLGGTMALVAGPEGGCGSEGSISGTVTLTAVSDSGNAKANNLRIE